MRGGRIVLRSIGFFFLATMTLLWWLGAYTDSRCFSFNDASLNQTILNVLDNERLEAIHRAPIDRFFNAVVVNRDVAAGRAVCFM
jgi:hypothetical protein